MNEMSDSVDRLSNKNPRSPSPNLDANFLHPDDNRSVQNKPIKDLNFSQNINSHQIPGQINDKSLSSLHEKSRKRYFET